MKLVYPAIFTPLEEQEGYCVIVPDLPGCVTQGSNIAEAIEMAIDAASGWVLDELEDGNKVPEPSEHQSYDLNPGQFINLIVLDMGTYAEKYGNKAVRKNCTIPSWLNTFAERANINYSNVLQKALIKELDLDRR